MSDALDRLYQRELTQNLVNLLNHTRDCRKLSNHLLSSLNIDTVQDIFDRNPVLNEGIPKDLRETNESYHTDKFISAIELLQKASATLLQAEKLLLRMGLHHVRLEVRKAVPHGMEEDNECSP